MYLITFSYIGYFQETFKKCLKTDLNIFCSQEHELFKNFWKTLAAAVSELRQLARSDRNEMNS